MQVGKNKNEWLVIYLDECGDRQIQPRDNYVDAFNTLDFLSRDGVSVLGIVMTLWYHGNIEKIVELEIV